MLFMIVLQEFRLLCMADEIILPVFMMKFDNFLLESPI